MGQINNLFRISTLQKKVLILIKLFTVFVLLVFILAEKNHIYGEKTYIVMSIVVVIAALILDFAIYKMVIKPIEHITTVAEAINNFNFEKRCKVKTNDELERLSNSMNRMLDELKNENQKLENKYKHEKKLLSDWKNLIEQLSHGMKTPLSIIKAHAIGILDSREKDQADKYAKVIEGEVETLNNMIKSLLKLSEIESGVADVKFEQFDIVELVETVAGRLLLNPIYEKINLKYELPKDKIFINADLSMMKTVLENLFTNVIKYSSGDRNVELNMYEKNDKVVLSIYNDSNYIDELELEKIWDKFYRKEKSRNLQSSGLGLAIVKSILDIHDITYTAKNIKSGIEISLEINCEKASV